MGQRYLLYSAINGVLRFGQMSQMSGCNGNLLDRVARQGAVIGVNEGTAPAALADEAI